MKKLAIGCLVVLVLCGVVVAGVSFYVYRQARSFYTQVTEFNQVPAIEREIRKQDPFTPPASDELTAGQVERFVKVQTQIRQKVGSRFAEMEQKYKVLSEKREATIADAPALFAAYRDLAASWMDAKRSQVAALNETGLSLAEYKWIREQIYRALGVPYMDLDVSRIVQQIQSGATTPESGQVRGSIGPSGPESNRTLIAPYRKQLEDNLPLASFGL